MISLQNKTLGRRFAFRCYGAQRKRSADPRKHIKNARDNGEVATSGVLDADGFKAVLESGVVGDGACKISLGTSGTIFISSEKFGVDPNNALHAFAHADGKYHLMG